MFKPLLFIFSLSGWVIAFWVFHHPPKERVVIKTEYRDQIVTKEQVRTVVAQDGSKIETRTIETNKTAQGSVAYAPSKPLPKYGLGLSYETNLSNFNNVTQMYNLHLSRRLWESPLWTTITISSNKSLAIGLSIEF